MDPILFPALALIGFTVLVGFIHTYVSISIMNPNKEFKDGIPLAPYESSPENLKLIKNNIKNLFEFPVLFYVLIGIIFLNNFSDTIFLVLTWSYFAFRALHSYVHIFMRNTNIRGMLWIFTQLILLIIFIKLILIEFL